MEHAGLSLLIALLAIAGIAALASGSPRAARELGTTLTRKLRCAAVGPGPCWRDPLTVAYGRSVAGAVRALAPAPRALAGLLPVDFRRCRIASCALPGPASPRLTASNRRTTAFVSVSEGRGSEGGVAVEYWLYRPTVGWEVVRRLISSEEVKTLAATPLLDEQVPALVPLETLPGANHYEFSEGEEPPWRWQIARR